jgi:hypothetical protein
MAAGGMIARFFGRPPTEVLEALPTLPQSSKKHVKLVAWQGLRFRQ